MGIVGASERLMAASMQGDVATVRGIACDLLAHSTDEETRHLAARAMMWVGDFAEALPALPPRDHIFRARAYARLGMFDESEREIYSAVATGSFPLVDSDLINVLKEVCGLAASVGRRGPWLPLAKKSDALLPRSFWLLKDGHWDAAVAALKDECLKPAPPRLARIRPDPLPLWRGQPVKHLVIFAHAGYCGNGDVFHFARYVELARERCERLSLVVEQPLEALARRCLPVDEVVCGGREWPVIEVADAFCSLMMGPLLADMLDVTYASPWQITPIEGTKPFLFPLLEARHTGLCWSASPKASAEGSWARRSIPFSSMAPLASLPGTRFHSLQVGSAAGQAQPWVQRHELRTWEDTASLIAALDAVVTVDTSVAHLAASMGKPVHLILTEYEDWRWGTGETTPWYPTTMRIYRGDVDESVRRIGERLEKA